MGKALDSKKVCLLILRFVHDAGEVLPYKQKWRFLITNPLNVGISFD